MTLPTRLVLDTNCLIYRLDDATSARARWLDDQVLAPAVAGELTLFVSSVSLAELLVRPYRDGQPHRAQAVHRALRTLPGLTIEALTAEMADTGAQLRAETGLRLPDALILATAQVLDATLLSNDARLLEPRHEVPVLLLDEQLS